MATFKQWTKDGFTVTTDPELIDLDKLHKFLFEDSYWAQGRSRDLVETSLRHSLNFALLDEKEGNGQVGFARVVTDYATFAWLADVYVDSTVRGKGLGKFLISCVVAHPELRGLKRLLLATADAHGLYKQFGFEVLKRPERMMERLCGGD